MLAQSFKPVLAATKLLFENETRPIVNKTKRNVYKVLTILITLLYILYIILANNVYLSNILMISILIQTFLVLPISYKLFGLEYNNYKKYERRTI